MKRRITFIVNGLGLGNSTRCYGVIQQLSDKDIEIHVITSGNGIWFFENAPEISAVHKIQSLYYGKNDRGKLSILTTVRSIYDYTKIIRSNAEQVRSLFKQYPPDVVVTDSDYTYFPVKELNIPLIGLNNSDVVVESYRMFRNIPNSIKPHYYGVEFPDYIFHRLVPDRVISPTFNKSLPCRVKKIIRVSPIVRHGYIREVHSRPVSKVVIMLSGSVFGSPVVLTQKKYPVKIEVIGRPAPNNFTGHKDITYHGKIRDTHALLEDADLLVVNGGFSAVSEAFMMNKPMLVIPVPNHAEQWINAKTIEYLKVGAIGSEITLEEDMLRAIEKIELFRAGYQVLPGLGNGASDAAKTIISFAYKY